MGKMFKKLLLLGGDILFLHLALLLTLMFRYPDERVFSIYAMHWPDFAFVFLIWIVVFYILSLYNLNIKVSDLKFVKLAVNAIVVSSVLSVIYFYMVVQPAVTPKTNLAIFIGIYTILFVGWRVSYLSLIVRVMPPVNLAIIGYNKFTENLLEELKKNPGSAYTPILIFRDPRRLDNLTGSITENMVKAIVVCDDFGESDRMETALFSCLPYNVDFFNYPDFYEMITGKFPVEAIGQNWFLENLKEGQKINYHRLKRFLDVTLACIILLVTLPFYLLIGLAIKMTSTGPVFFRQVRVGKNEKEYVMLKFRTMRTTANDGTPTEKNDKRITRVGIFLRKTRLDEIPQVFNILKGDMSFIGPRPERPEIILELERHIPFYKTRLLIKPGLTGWDQISGNYHSPSVVDTMEKLQHDLYYLKHRSLSLDLSITLKTVATVIFHEGR
jgi:exopolysaccharide biosynthesis polyprenyl glycosylphosphotransferase